MTRTVLGVLAAIAVTTAMDAGGVSVFSALPLAAWLALFWWWEGFSRSDVGFRWGALRDYLPAVLYPLVVIGLAVAVAWGGGAIDTSETNWSHFWLNFLVGGVTSMIVVVVTEEGFFRGWLWASLTRAGQSPKQVALWTSVIFSLWHLSGVALETGFDLPAAQIPIYLLNAALLGLIWGLMRAASGSVLVASVSHGLWNGLAYALFAFGTEVGALGVQETAIYGPEVGWVGLVLHGAVALGMWRWTWARVDADSV